MSLFEQQPTQATPPPRRRPSRQPSLNDEILVGHLATLHTRYMSALARAGQQGLADAEAAEVLGVSVDMVGDLRTSRHADPYVVRAGSRYIHKIKQASK